MPRFGDSSLESAFLDQYREGALQAAYYAAIAASVVFASFLSVALLAEETSWIAISIRIVLVGLLVSCAFTIRNASGIASHNYTTIVGGASLIVLAGTVVLLSLGPTGMPHAVSGASPALMLGLFIHYSFLRLPLVVAGSIGWAVSIANMIWGAPMVVGGSANARTLLYLVFANIAGLVISKSLESRERQLFIQRRRAEQAQAELKERARAAEEAHQEKTRLLAAVSHDLRQPMMAARAYLGALSGRLRKGDVTQAERQAALLGGSIDMLGATLDHLLTAARYDSGTEPIRIESVELGPILHRLRETFASDAAARGIELRVRQPDRRLVVTTDATALWRILMNIVSNGIKFTQGNGRPGRGVLVAIRLDRGVCRIDIADTGIGIAPRHLTDIWQPYFQVANAERNRERGLGLGLFLVNRALDHLPQHKLSVRSRPGRGSRFSLTLPGAWFNQPEAAPREPALLTDGDLDVLHGGYVLVLEDDRDARQALQEMLSDWGVLYSSGATLEELATELDTTSRTVDALVSDYRLPGEHNGIESIGILRDRLGSAVPAVLITGESDLRSIERRLPANTVLLQKPFDPAAIAAPLVAAIGDARRLERL